MKWQGNKGGTRDISVRNSLQERGIYVHVNEREENGSVTAMDGLFGEENLLRDREHTLNFCSAMHSLA